MQQDKIFAHPRKKVEPFSFNAQVAAVFDNMLDRSVPAYRETLQIQSELTRQFYQAGTQIYDLGCSNGNQGLNLIETMGETPFSMVAIDNSQPMVDLYRQRLASWSHRDNIEIKNDDICTCAYQPASVFIINLTLQFLSPDKRDDLLEKIHRALVPGGILLLSEKIRHEEASLDKLQQQMYYRFKEKNGYSQLEISQKREALDNVLIPDSLEEHLNRLRTCGFTAIDVWYKWFNFTSLICIKK